MSFGSNSQCSLLARQSSISTVTIKIGPAPHTIYNVQTSFLTHHSDYFKGALQGSWKEAQENSITLEDVEQAEFNLFVEWMYTQRLPEAKDDWFVTSGTDTPGVWLYKENAIDLLRMRLYVFADRFIVPLLFTQVRKEIVSLENIGTHAVVELAFENLPDNDLMRRFLVDIRCVNWEADIINDQDRESAKKMHPTFLYECMEFMAKRLLEYPGGLDFELDLRNYD
jgi:hypothetical protein